MSDNYITEAELDRRRMKKKWDKLNYTCLSKSSKEVRAPLVKSEIHDPFIKEEDWAWLDMRKR